MTVGAVAGVEGLEVELLYRLDHEPGEVVLGQSRRSGGSRRGWSLSQVRKFWGMSPFSSCKRTEKRGDSGGAQVGTWSQRNGEQEENRRRKGAGCE